MSFYDLRQETISNPLFYKRPMQCNYMLDYPLHILRVGSAVTHSVGNHKLSWHFIFFHEQFLGTSLTWKSQGSLWRAAKAVCECVAYLRTGIPPKGERYHGAKAEPHHMADICAVDVQLLKMNLENTVPREGSFEGWLSVILGWGNWNALDRSPWSPLTFIKGAGLHRKIAGLFLSVCRLWCWISYGLRTEKAFLPFKTTLVQNLQDCWEVSVGLCWCVDWVWSLCDPGGRKMLVIMNNST